MTARVPLRVVLIAPLRFPIRRPFAGGLESAVWNEVRQLRARGHQVSLIASDGSDFLDPADPFTVPALTWPPGSRATDDTYPPEYENLCVPALSRALDEIARRPGRYDVISNHCLHGMPLSRAGELGVPMVTTLHTPVDADLVAAHRAASGHSSRFLSVSEHTRSQWRAAGIESTVLPNGVDPRSWPLGPGGDGLVWFGRIVPEKAPHLAIDAAQQLGRPLTIAGRIGDEEYAAEFVLPRLGPGVRYVKHLPPRELAHVVGRSACSIASPAWQEPFGLSAPESLMCGTPVASFAVGGVPEIAHGSAGMATAPEGDLSGLVSAAAVLLDRSHRDASFRTSVRADAVARFSLSTRTRLLENHFWQLVGSHDTTPERAA